MSALGAILRGRWLALITWTLLGAAVAGLINMVLPVVYEAKSNVLIVAPNWNDSTALADPNIAGGKSLAYGDEFTQQRMASYARLATTPLVTGRVSEQLRLGESGEELAKRVSARLVPDTVMLQIRAQDESPARAASIADAVAVQTISVIKDVERPTYSRVSPVQPMLFEPASVPARPISPRTLLNIACGAAIGLLLGVTYAAAYGAVRETRRLERLRCIDDPIPGETPGAIGVLTADDQLPLTRAGNDAKLLRLEVIQRLSAAGVKSVVLTSPRATPATSGVAAVLARAIAETGKSTIVVWADFGAGKDGEAVGLGDLLGARMFLDSVIVSDEDTGISWIPPGTTPETPTREITGPRMQNLLVELSTRFEYIVVIGPPALELADAVDLTSMFGASILVDLVPQTTLAEVRESERLLKLAQGAYLGRIAVAGRAFSEHPDLPQAQPLQSATSSWPGVMNGESWSY